MNPTFFNTPRIRASSLPAATGHFSARALATFYASLLPNAHTSLFTHPSRGVLQYMTRSASNGAQKTLEGEKMLQGEGGTILQGYTLFPTSVGDGNAVAFGHSGLGIHT